MSASFFPPAGVLNNFDATVNPTVNDDSGDGYEVGSRWINLTADSSYTCVDASVGAAIWENNNAPLDGTVAGQMTFWDGTDWVHTETSELFWDDVDKELSIGSSAGPEEIIHASANTNDNRAIKIENINAGTAAVSRIIVANDVGSSFFAGYSSGFTQSGAKIPNSSALVASGNRANGMSIVAKGSAAPVRFYAGGNGDAHLRAIIDPTGNLGINTIDQFGSGVKVIGIANATTVPTTNPTAGGVLWVEGGLLKYRDSAGNVYLISHDLTELKWDDLRVPLSSTIKSGSKIPGFSVFQNDGGGSQGVFLYWFDKSLEEELYFATQLPHSYAEGTDIHFHVHWTPKTTGGAGEFVRWGLEYTWKNIGETYGNTTIIYSDATTAAAATTAGDDPLLIDKHYLTLAGSISGTGKTVSSMIVGRIFRDSTDATDDYDDDAGLLEIDFHFQNDGRGSSTQFVK